MKNLLISFIVLLISSTVLSAQLKISAEVRPRYENRHGYKSLVTKDTKAGSFISQRTRLNVNYAMDKIRFGLSLQNIRVWGDASTLTPVDKYNAFHQAWAEVSLMDHLSLKMGRQEIIYDDHRIFGNVGWAQQARSHDAAIFKYSMDNNRVDIGFAFNSDGQVNTQTPYSGIAGYKNFQYLWYHGKFAGLGLSILALNTGNEYTKDGDLKVDYMQTVGPRITYKMGALKANAAAYFQTGKKTDQDVKALYYSVNAAYKLMGTFSIGAGMEYLSGKASNDTEAGFKSFAPLFGTNHKFNGWMDYFYVGNHFNNVGLLDINFPIIYSKNKLSVKAIPHLFSAAADVYNQGTQLNKKLGTEIDFNLGYKLAKGVSLNAGYSVMLATETMEYLKGGSKDVNNTWAWVMFTIKPSLFNGMK